MAFTVFKSGVYVTLVPFRRLLLTADLTPLRTHPHPNSTSGTSSKNVTDTLGVKDPIVLDYNLVTSSSDYPMNSQQEL